MLSTDMQTPTIDLGPSRQPFLIHSRPTTDIASAQQSANQQNLKQIKTESRALQDSPIKCDLVSQSITVNRLTFFALYSDDRCAVSYQAIKNRATRPLQSLSPPRPGNSQNCSTLSDTFRLAAYSLLYRLNCT